MERARLRGLQPPCRLWPSRPDQIILRQGGGAPPHPVSRYQCRTVRWYWGPESVRGRRGRHTHAASPKNGRAGGVQAIDLGSTVRPLRLDPLDEKLDELLELRPGGLLHVLGHRDHRVAVAVEGPEPVRSGSSTRASVRVTSRSPSAAWSATGAAPHARRRRRIRRDRRRPGRAPSVHDGGRRRDAQPRVGTLRPAEVRAARPQRPDTSKVVSCVSWKASMSDS